MAEHATLPTRHADYWHGKLDDAPPVLQLPTDRPRPTVLDADRGRVEAELPGAVFDRLAADAGVPQAVVLVSAWHAVISRHTGESDLVMGILGVPDGIGVSGATPTTDEPVVTRVRVPADITFRQLLQAVATELAEAADHTEGSVADLLVTLGAEVGAGKHPVFQVAVAPGRAADLDDGFAPCDAVLRWRTDGDDLTVTLDYATALFDEARMRRMIEHMGVLLSGAAPDPGTRVVTLPLLTTDERELLSSWNATTEHHDASRPVATLFDARADRTPDAVAVEHHDRRMTYAELDRAANRVAHELQHRGVGPDVAVAVSMERSVEQVIAVLAVLKAGGAYVPVDASYPESRRSFMLDNSGAPLVLTRSADPEVAWADDSVEVLVVDELPDGPDHRPANAAEGGHLGYVVYTSGSTGQPKGVALPQRAMTNLIDWQTARPGYAEGARTLQFSSLSFDVSFQEILGTWASGGTLVLVEDAVRRDPASLLAHLREHEVARLHLPFVALRGLADAAVTRGELPTALREVYTAGEQLQVDDTLRTFFSSLSDCRLENQYGPSESHVATAFTLDPDPSTWSPLPPIGAPIANTQVQVLDAEGGQLPVGVPGELHIGGVCLARGYLGRDDLTAERFRSDLPGAPGRVYRTGDLARWQDDGTLEYLGRTDNQVKFRGFRIEPGEVGAVLSSYPGVRQCVAKVVEVPGVGARLAAYVLPAAGAQLSLAGLREHAAERLPDYMVPSHVMLVDALPLTPSGKVDTAALPAPSFDRRILANEYVAPTTAVEAGLTAIWSELLGVPQIGVRDDFFDLGGDSLMAVEMFTRIRERFDRDLPLGALAQDPTVAGLAHHLAADPSADWKALVPLRTGGAREPVFFIHGGAGNVASFPQLARQLPDDRGAYALQWDGLDGSRGSRSIEEMATSYLEQIRSVQPTGPYHLGGHCIGGLIGWELCRQLEAAGEEVGLLVLYDTPNVSSPHFHVAEGLPSVPARLRRPANRLTGAVGSFARLVTGKRNPRTFLGVRVKSALRRGAPTVDERAIYIEMVMVRAAWRYRVPSDVHAPTMLLHTGRESGLGIAMAGTWSDGVMGWSELLPADRVHRVPGGHNDLMYQDEAVALLRAALARPR